MHTSTHTADLPYAKSAGDEPLPGYRLIGPLGRGGFGEVWKCEAPGGLHKAVKFVAPDPDQTNSSGQALRQEYEAFQQIKAIRHPFLLQLERVELVRGELVMVMELADEQLQDRYNACVAGGLPGIPRKELLGYYVDAAEALDLMTNKHGLLHLDIKPANLFIIGGHVKVGDYGLVARMEAPSSINAPMTNRGLTPRYVAPEVLRGQMDPRSDQYSLALVYQELLTGTFPYTARSAQQMMMQHVSAKPDLSGVPEADRDAVGRALAKNPKDRFPSCLAFVHALIVGPSAVAAVPTSPPPPPVPRTPTRPDSTMADSTVTPHRTDRQPRPQPAARPTPDADRTRIPHTLPGGALPPLTAPGQRPRPQQPESAAEISLSIAPPEPGKVKLVPIESVVPTDSLLGHPAHPALLTADQFLEAVLAACAAGAGGYAPRMPGEIAVLPDGSWACRFPTTLLPSVVPLKLGTLIDDGWCDDVTQPEKNRMVLRAHAAGGGGLWGKLSGKKAGGAEVTVHLPTFKAGAASMSRLGSAAGGLGSTPAPVGRETAAGCGEVDVVGNLFGTPDAAFARTASEALPNLIKEVRRLLQNVDDRRKSPRLAVDTVVRLYPIHEDGVVLAPIDGRIRDVSAGGLSCATAAAVPTRYVYAEFPEIPMTAGQAILVRLTRSLFTGHEQHLAGRFRTDL